MTRPVSLQAAIRDVFIGLGCLQPQSSHKQVQEFLDDEVRLKEYFTRPGLLYDPLYQFHLLVKLKTISFPVYFEKFLPAQHSSLPESEEDVVSYIRGLRLYYAKPVVEEEFSSDENNAPDALPAPTSQDNGLEKNRFVTGKLLRWFRNQKKISQGSLALKMNCSGALIFNLEQGNRVFIENLKRRIERALGVDAYSLDDSVMLARINGQILMGRVILNLTIRMQGYQHISHQEAVNQISLKVGVTKLELKSIQEGNEELSSETKQSFEKVFGLSFGSLSDPNVLEKLAQV